MPSVNKDTSPPLTASDIISRSDFTELLILLKNVKAGCWVFALYNNLAVREEVLSALKRTIRPMPVFEWTYTPEAPAPISYLQNLTTIFHLIFAR